MVALEVRSELENAMRDAEARRGGGCTTDGSAVQAQKSLNSVGCCAAPKALTAKRPGK
jgi:hypothetical protein